MESIAKQQNVDRWAECTPLHIHYMNRIKKEIPNAQFIHIIRDGRDVALSLKKLSWTKPLPFNIADELSASALKWSWTVNKGRKTGKKIGSAYIEIHFEDLITNPSETLNTLGKFLKHELDYDTILEQGIGSVKSPNTAFKEEKKVSPHARWKTILNDKDIANVESLIGPELSFLGYDLKNPSFSKHVPLQAQFIKTLCNMFWQMKQLVKHNFSFFAFGETPQQFDKKMKKIFKNIS